VPHSVELQKQYGEDLKVLFVESQGHTLDDAEKMAFKKGWLNDLSMWTTEQPFQTGSNGIPHTVLLGIDGEVIYNGSPGSAVEDLIAEQIKLAKKGPKTLGPVSAKAWVDFEKGNYSTALAALEAPATGAQGAEADAAKKLTASLNTRLKAKIARLSWLIDNGEIAQADKLAPLLAKGVTGNATHEPKVKELTEKLAAKESANERAAADALDKVEKKIAKDGLDKSAIKQLAGIGEKFPNTKAAKRAAHLSQIAEG